jgi:alkanesulfonate monooxygenase SsuD/methylene tetrahydromethanopterin reductase-like flavin-dependent oxidoreductase (luciferase family)
LAWPHYAVVDWRPVATTVPLWEARAVTGLGMVFLPQLPPERLRAVAQAADDAGLEELWLWEDCFRESAIAAAAAALAWTTRLRVGIGLMPVPLRNVALTAMELATLDRMFPGRARVGVGHGVQSWMAQVGARAESPITLLREYTAALRALLAGQEVTTSGRYVRLDRVALDWPPAQPVPILAGATGPRSLKLSGECADGTILTAGTTPDSIRQSRAHIDEGRTAGGRSDPHPVIVYMHAATGPGAAPRLARERQRWGEDPAVGSGAAGDAPAIADAVERLAQAGASTVVLQPTSDDPDPESFARFVALEVRPLTSPGA